MFCVSLKFPYQYQIKKINSSLIPAFLKSVEVIAKNNGCKKIVKKDYNFYFFDSPLSSSFFTLRFLYSLSLLLKQVSKKIHESSVIVEYFSNENEVEYLTELQNINLDFNCILVGLKAAKYFKKYISLRDAKTSSFKCCTSFAFFENMSVASNFNENEKEALLFRKGQNYIQAIYNFILQHPIFDSDAEFLSKQETKAYFETRNVLSFYSRNRFNLSLPKYFVDAFIIYAKLYMKIYKNKHKIKEIVIYTDCKEEDANIEKLKQILEKFKVVQLPEKEFEIEKLPDDLLETIYVLIFATKFIFSNELEDFFFEATKTKAFSDLMKIMHQYNAILREDCIFSYQSVAIEKLEKKLKEKKDHYALFISKYLWSKYKNAEIECDFNLKKIFDELNFQYDKLFDIDIFFNLKNHYVLLQMEKNDLIEENIAELKKYNNIIKLKSDGKNEQAFSLTKELNSYFHSARILSGEYRSCSLLGFSFLENNNVGEALTYFTYSLEIAKKTKNPSFICEALCFLSIVCFLQKDFQNCSITLQELSNSISLFFMQEWKVLCLFIQARVFIELGEAKKASTAFKLAKDFASLYFKHLEKTCDIWYGRALVAEGKVENGRKILEDYEDRIALLFFLESLLLFPDAEEIDIFELKRRYDELSSRLEVFPFFEDIAWFKVYKHSIATRLFNAFYHYYVIVYCSKTTRTQMNEHLEKLDEMAMASLYSKDNNATIYLYLLYMAQCKVDGEATGKALGVLSKACNVMQKNTTFMYETSMRDKFMKRNLWNARLFDVIKENKFI